MPYYIEPRFTPPRRREPFLPAGSILLFGVAALIILVLVWTSWGDSTTIERTCYAVASSERTAPTNTYCVEEIAP